jgi:hypothetical protein
VTRSEPGDTLVEVRSLYPLFPPLRVDTEDSVNQYWQVTKAFERGRTLLVRGSTYHDNENLLIVSAPCSAQNKRLFKDSFFLDVGHTILDFSGTFEFPGTEKFVITSEAGAKIPHTDEELLSIWKSFLGHELDLTIQSYLCALTIAYSGAVRPTGNIWFLNGKQEKADAYYVSQIHDSVEFLGENKAFPKIDIDPDAAVAWIFRQNGIFDGYSDTPVSRALNYFTRLFAPDFRNDELSDLIWALAGIEALLVQGGRSSGGQLREKLGAIFGSQIDSAWLTRMITESYNYRSRMIHGDRQIRSSFRTDDSDTDKRFYEEYHSKLFSIGILTLLLQYVVSNDLSEINFQTIVDLAGNSKKVLLHE